MNVIRKDCAEQNFRSGRLGFVVEAIVIHLIDGSQVGCDATFASNSLSLRRSAHYSVGKTGGVHQYVDEHDTAYHAGRILQPSWSGLKAKPDGTFINPNLYTIGVEHEGRVDDEWRSEMYEASSELLAGLAKRHGLGALKLGSNVVRHRDIFAAKSCPGNKVDLDRLIEEANKRANEPAVPSASPGSNSTGATPLEIVHKVNVRLGRASITAPITRTLAPGEKISASKETEGDKINGIDLWYELEQGQFIWAGATNKP